MKTLQNIQKLSKLAKVLCRIVFVCCIIGFCGCLFGLITFASLDPNYMFEDGRSFVSLIESESGYSVNHLISLMVSGMLISAGEAVVAKFAEHYFTRELNDGTPFTFDGAKEILRLGIINICVSIGAVVLASIAHEIFKATLSNVGRFEISNTTGISVGIAFILISLIFKHGAEIQENKSQQDAKKDIIMKNEKA